VSAAPVTPENTPEILSPADVATSGHILRLYDEEGADLNKLVYLNADGSRTLYLYDHPVKYVDADGTIRDISLDIRSLVGGAFRKIAYGLPFVHAVEVERAVLAGNLAEGLPHMFPVVIYAVLITIGAVLLFLRQMKKQ
jgi:hypothetical protein